MLLRQAIENKLQFEQFESLVLRAIETYKHAPIYDMNIINADRCSSIRKNQASAYMYLISAAAGKDQAKFETYIKLYIQSQNLALYYGSSCKTQAWVNTETLKAA